jgi:hypothetical protein
MEGSDMYQVQIAAGVLEEKQDQSYSRLQMYQVPMCTRCRVIASSDVHQVCQIRGIWGVSEVFRKNKKGCVIIPDDNIT